MREPDHHRVGKFKPFNTLNVSLVQYVDDVQCVFDVDFTDGLTLIEMAEGVTVNEIKAKTEAPFNVADDVKPMI